MTDTQRIQQLEQHVAELAYIVEKLATRAVNGTTDSDSNMQNGRNTASRIHATLRNTR